VSSLPGYKLEDYVAWNWNLRVDGEAENNMSLGLAELLGSIKPRPGITKEQFAPILAIYEPFREDVERRLEDFDEDTQSWRDYAQYVCPDISDELEAKAEALVKELRCPAPASSTS